MSKPYEQWIAELADAVRERDSASADAAAAIARRDAAEWAVAELRKAFLDEHDEAVKKAAEQPRVGERGTA